MFLKKKAVVGFCSNCNSIKQGYQVTFNLNTALGLNALVYFSLLIIAEGDVGLENSAVNLFWVAFPVLVGYKTYISAKNKKRCLTCKNELTDE